jgi:hypothetical protein
VSADVRVAARTGLAKNRLYYFRVRAIGAGSPPVYSGFSNTASAKTPKR